jgi:hypothetical protein
MTKRISYLLLLAISLLLTSLPAGAQSQMVGVIVNEDSAFEGYTLFAPKHYTMTYLIDNDGQIVNSWESDYEPGQSVYLLENGHLLHTSLWGAERNPTFSGGGEGGRVEEYDWDGNLIWEFDYSSDKYMSHHDIEPLPNGNILLIAFEYKTVEEAIAAGRNPNLLSDGALWPDSVIEIEPTLPVGGNIVWEWHVWDHLVQDYDSSKANYGIVGDHPELIDVNFWAEAGQAHANWNHVNSIDYNAELDQIMISVRGFSEIWIIDHSTTTTEAAGHTGGRSNKGGELLYRWGNPMAYRAGDSSDQKLFDQHDSQWIETGLPGEGNILIFNNGNQRGYSSADEIAPPVDNDGNYTLETGAAYGPSEQVWVYTAPNKTDLFSEAISGVQRLPNGNTLICNGVNGIFIEVTSSGEIVWQYVNPIIDTGPLAEGETVPLDHRGHALNAVFKIHRYAPDYVGLQGHDLTPSVLVEDSDGATRENATPGGGGNDSPPRSQEDEGNNAPPPPQGGDRDNPPPPNNG